MNASLLLADELNAVLDEEERPVVDNGSSDSGDLHLGGIESCLSDTDTAPINNRSPRKPSKSFIASTNNNNRNSHPLKKIDLTKMMVQQTNHSPNNSKGKSAFVIYLVYLVSLFKPRLPLFDCLCKTTYTNRSH